MARTLAAFPVPEQGERARYTGEIRRGCASRQRRDRRGAADDGAPRLLTAPRAVADECYFPPGFPPAGAAGAAGVAGVAPGFAPPGAAGVAGVAGVAPGF